MIALAKKEASFLKKRSKKLLFNGAGANNSQTDEPDS